MAKKKNIVPARSLARPGDPLITPDGQKWEPIGAKIDVKKQIKAKARTYKPTTHRDMSQLGADSGVLNGIGCVLVYSLLGVSVREIAEALRVKEEDVKDIKKHPSYSEIFDMLRDEFINANNESIELRIAAYSNEAVSQMAHLAFNGEQEVVQFRATQDLLDRGGVSRKVGVQGGSSNGDNALRIVVTNGDNRTEVSVGGDEIVPNRRQ